MFCARVMGVCALVIAVTLTATSAHARSPGCNGDPWNLKCTGADFLDPIFASPQWYAQNGIARDATLRDCVRKPPFPGWTPPPAHWCRAAAASMGIKAPPR